MGSNGRKIFGNPFIALLLAIYIHQWTYAGPIDTITSTESPKRMCGIFSVYLNETGQCYLEGSKGPCREHMVVKITDEIQRIGTCECEQPRCVGRPTVYWPEKNRCYYIFSKGPCTQGQWIVPSTEVVGKCENIPCLDEYNRQVKIFKADVFGSTFQYNYVFPYKNNCYITNAEDDGLCPEGEKASFDTPTPTHTCSKPAFCPTPPGRTWVIAAFGSNTCPPGEEPDTHGDCQPQTEFD